MKLYLVKEQCVPEFDVNYSYDSSSDDEGEANSENLRPDIELGLGMTYCTSWKLKPEFIPFNDSQDEIKFCDKIRGDYFREAEKSEYGIDQKIYFNISLCKELNTVTTEEHHEMHESSGGDAAQGHCEGFIEVVGPWLDSLSILSCFNPELLVNAEVFCSRPVWVKKPDGKWCVEYANARSTGVIMVPGMRLNFSNLPDSVRCDKMLLKLPKGLCNNFNFQLNGHAALYSAKVTLVLNIEDYAFPKTLEEIFSGFTQPPDFIIVSRDNKNFNCHTEKLKAHSPMFEMYFRGGREESKMLKMNDLSSAGVDAFLKYLYTSAVDGPNEDTRIAFELLKIGYEYRIRSLETGMSTILRQKPAVRVDLEVALGLFLFARKAKRGNMRDRLMSKAVDVLVKRRTQFVESGKYRQLFATDLEAAMEFGLMTLKRA